MAVKTPNSLIMLVVVLCAAAATSATLTSLEGTTLQADEVGLYADALLANEFGQYGYAPAPSTPSLDDTSLGVGEVGSHANAPTPFSTGLDDALLVDEVVSPANTPTPSSTGLDDTLLVDEVGPHANAPTPSSTGLEDTSLADEVAPSIASQAPSTGLDETFEGDVDDEVVVVLSPAPAKAPSLAESNKDDVAESIQEIIGIQRCVYEIIAFANYKMGEKEKVGPACCKAVEAIIDHKSWPKIFPFNPYFTLEIKGHCTQYAVSPALAPTTTYAPAPLEGGAYTTEDLWRFQDIEE